MRVIQRLRRAAIEFLGLDNLGQRTTTLHHLSERRWAELANTCERLKLEVQELQAVKQLVPLPSPEDVETRLDCMAWSGRVTESELTFAALADELRVAGVIDPPKEAPESLRTPRVNGSEKRCSCTASVGTTVDPFTCHQCGKLIWGRL